MLNSIFARRLQAPSLHDRLSSYSDDAVSRALHAAEDWLSDEDEAFPHSWEQAASDGSHSDRREVPTIAGYDLLEAKGFVVRGAKVSFHGQERVQFLLTAAGRDALRG